MAAEAFNRFDKEWIEFRRPLKLLNASEKEDIFKDYLDGAISAESSGNTKVGTPICFFFSFSLLSNQNYRQMLLC